MARDISGTGKGWSRWGHFEINPYCIGFQDPLYNILKRILRTFDTVMY